MRPSHMRQAVQHLKQCEKMALLIERHSAPQINSEPDAWRALSSSIIGQQISVHAARAIRGRFAALTPERDFPTPTEILDAPDEQLRGVGLSANKVLSLRDLARHFEDGKINSSRFAKMENEEIIQALLPVRGIGRWTAEMFLIFSLGRMDVFAVDDLGLRNALKKLYELPEAPKPVTMRELATPWQPYRSVASWYLWRSLDNEPKVK